MSHETAPAALTLHVPNTTAGTPGLATGVTIQGHANASLEKLAAHRHRERCQNTVTKLNKDKRRAEAAVNDARVAYDKAVAAIVVPPQFVADLVAVVAPLRVFLPDVTATNAADVPFVAEKKRRKKAGAVVATPEQEEVDDEVTPTVTVTSATQFTVVGKLRSGGRDLVRLTRIYELPQEVMDAAKVQSEAVAEVASIERQLAEVRTQMTRASEVGELAAAQITAAQLSQSAEGQVYLTAVDALVDEVGDKAGLEAAARPPGQIAGAKALPATRPTTDAGA